MRFDEQDQTPAGLDRDDVVSVQQPNTVYAVVYGFIVNYENEGTIVVPYPCFSLFHMLWQRLHIFRQPHKL